MQAKDAKDAKTLSKPWSQGMLTQKAICVCALVLAVAPGCVGIRSTPFQQFVAKNPTIVTEKAEVVEISIDHWVKIELEQGLGKLMRSASQLKSTIPTDPAQRKIADDYAYAVLEEASFRFVNAVTKAHEIRARMRKDDRLFYCRAPGELYGHLYITRHGEIQIVVRSAMPWEAVEQEALWKKISERIRK